VVAHDDDLTRITGVEALISETNYEVRTQFIFFVNL